MNGTRIKIANGEYVDSVEIRRAMLAYVYEKAVFEGIIARGMPLLRSNFLKLQVLNLIQLFTKYIIQGPMDMIMMNR